MLCEEKIQMPLPLEGLVERLVGSRNPPPKSLPAESTSPPLGPEKLKSSSKEYHRQYYQNHKAQYREYYRREYRRNIDSYRERRSRPEYKARQAELAKSWREKNADKRKEGLRKWHEAHPDYMKEYRKQYAERRRELYQQDKEKICARKRELSVRYRGRVRQYSRRRRRTDISYALKDRMRATLNRAFRRKWIRKPYRTEALVGCSIDFLKSHIERQFVNGMCWENRSSFVIDHHVPVAAFDLRDHEEALVAFNWRNLRPITQHENATKSSTLPHPLPSWIPAHLASRIESRRACF